MVRPCFLIVDREYAGSISTRKLVIETAKLNVITAYSGKEALETIGRFPAVDGIVLDSGVQDISCTELVGAIKSSNPTLPVIIIGDTHGNDCPVVDFHLDTFDPTQLLALLKSLKPEESLEVSKRDQSLQPRQQ